MDEVEKPKLFWNHPTGRIMSTIVHDMNSATCSAGASILLIERHLKQDVIDKEYILERLSRITKALKRAEDAVDYGYRKFEEKEGYK